MRVLVACEFSGVVRDAFASCGHSAASCDLLPSEKPGWHMQCDVRDVLGMGWDLMMATDVVSGRYPRRHLTSPSEHRWKDRSRTYTGIAAAMALQWGVLPRD
jgi:hypothetical protein